MMSYKKLKNHVGGLIRLKTQLWRYETCTFDNNPGRVCLFLDVKPHDWRIQFEASTASCQESWYSATGTGATTAALLLIDGSPQWVWTDLRDVESIK